MGQYTSRPDRARLQRARAREQLQRSRHSASLAPTSASAATTGTTTPQALTAVAPSSPHRPPATTQPSSQRTATQQSLRRRRSSTNTQSSLPPSRRRRLPLRFWSRGNTNGDTESDEPMDAHVREQSSTFSSEDSASNRFIEELDDIASHLSQTLQQLPTNSAQNSIHHARSSASINSDLSTSGPISFRHQTEMLARLLEVAASSTVVTLMGSTLVNGRRFDNTSRSETDQPTDTTFQEFVTSLRNGLLTNELSRNYQDHNADNMTFFRAFRFDSDNSTSTTGTPSPTPSTATPSTSTRAPDEPTGDGNDDSNNTPAIPVMIIGVRSVQQGPEAFESALQDNADWVVRGSGGDRRRQARASPNTASSAAASANNTDPLHSNDHATATADRREDIQEPNPSQPAQLSWVIFVMGNSFAWNHPLLSAPSLVNENPTYEDLLNLQELIGQVKPQVTTQEELLKHDDQLFELKLSAGMFTPMSKYPIYCDDSMTIEERCQICLTEYENNDVVRKLSSCNHLYHQECIDTWLLNGKNNCPLCRSKGITSQETAASTTS